MNYLEWNDLVAGHFFNEENAGKEILLYVNDEIINGIGKKSGDSLGDFIESVKAGPPWASRSGLCQRALQAFENWRERELRYPPYIAYLALFVLAAGIEGDFAPHAYYPRLRKLLGEDEDAGTLPSFDRMIDLWDDLEKWSVEDKHEELGRFIARIRGGWWKVGLPLSQTVVSKEELKRLPLMFEEAGLDPSAPPSEQVMLRLIRYQGEKVFERRTLRVLGIEQGDDVVLRNTLVDIVLAELEAWDGTVQLEDKRKQGEEQPYRISSGLRLCLEYDSLAKQVKTSLRLKANRPYPEEGLTLVSQQFPERVFYCEEAYQGWSKKLKDAESKLLDGASVNWGKDMLFEDSGNNWRAWLKGSKVRLFTDGRPDGLPGWVETKRLERGVPFLVCASPGSASTVQTWGQASCASFEQLEAEGLPSGWKLFKGVNASGSCEGIEVLTACSAVRMLLRGGVRIKGGNTYLYTAPPVIVVENSPGQVMVTANGKQLKKCMNSPNAWELPGDLQPNQVIRVVAATAEGELVKVLRVEAPSLPGDLEDAPWRSRDGEVFAGGDGGTRIRGAVAEVGPASASLAPFAAKPPQRRSVILLGSVPGQIARWPSDGLPASWQPVWSVEKAGRKKWKVSCCCKSAGQVPLPDIKARAGTNGDVKQWRKFAWVRRKKLTEPDIPAVREKWLEFSEAAKNV